MVRGVGPKGMRFHKDKLGLPRRNLEWIARNRSVNPYFLGHTPNLSRVTDVESFLQGQNLIHELLGKLTGHPPAAPHETE